MKKKFISPIIFLGLATLAGISYSCKPKDNKSVVVKQDEESESTGDANDSREESDAVLDEANTVLNDNKGKLGGRLEAIDADTNNIGATSITISGDSMITIVYNNSISKDLRRTKTGTVVIKRVGTKQFDEVNGQFSVDYQNLMIKRSLDQKKIVINGKFNIKNTTGGFAWASIVGLRSDSVKHEITGSVNVAFNDENTRTWDVSKKRTYGKLKVVLSQIEGADYIEKGSNRRDNSFVTKVPNPIVAEINTSCGGTSPNAKIISGKLEHTVTSGAVPTVITATFGYAGSNSPTTDYCQIKGYLVTWKRVISYGPYFIQTYP